MGKGAPTLLKAAQAGDTALLARLLEGGASVGEVRVVADMHERKRMMFEEAESFVALPGGIGTLEELVEMLTWAQLGFHEKPCGLLNIDGYYDHLATFLDHAIEEGFALVDGIMLTGQFL